MHSSLNITLPDLVGSTPENFPFVNHETFNTLATTIIYRKGGAYVKTAGEPGTGTCSSDFGLNGWDATQLIEGKWPRDWLLEGGKYGSPGKTPSGSFIGPAYESDPVDASDRSKGYVNKPETQSGRIYCVKYVGEGNGDYETCTASTTTRVPSSPPALWVPIIPRFCRVRGPAPRVTSTRTPTCGTT